MAKRAVIFAHYDKHNIIDAHVVYYLNGLKKLNVENIFFVSDSDINSYELEKIENIITKAIVGHHGEYDFGSYKRGFLAIEKPEQYDEIIFCNDSCYGPLFPFQETFEKMEKKECDFWGLTQNYYGWGLTQNYYGVKKLNKKYVSEPNMIHIQSFFFVLSKIVFTSKTFINFISSIKKEANKFDIIINYEIGLTKILSKEFSFNTYVPLKDYSYTRAFTNDKAFLKYRDSILKYRSPLIKVSEFKEQLYLTRRKYKKIIKKNTTYPLYLINNHKKRILTFKELKTKIFIRIPRRTALIFLRITGLKR